MSGCGREAILDVLEWSGGHPGCPEFLGRPSRMSGSSRETIPAVRGWWEAHPDVREWTKSYPEFL